MSDEKNTTPIPTATTPPPVRWPHRDQKYLELYANHASFDVSAWDLKVTFEVIDQIQGLASPYRQLASVHLAWPQVKIMAYYLFVNLVFHEASDGAIPVPDSVKPTSVAEVFKDAPDQERAKVVIERIERMREALGL